MPPRYEITYAQKVRTLERWASSGATGRLLVVYTWRGENIRIISARVADVHEREQYEAER
jgi:uncharacterized DUF497 family protein